MTGDRQRLTRLAFGSIFIAFAVMGLKFVAWRLTGSVALYSDALESIVNVIASFIALVAVRVSYLPADKSHPFGHHKAEYFSAVGEGVLIVLAALAILAEVVSALRAPPEIQHADIGLAVNLMATAVNSAWAFLLMRNGRKYRSPALTADAQHIWTDVITSVGVVAGIIAALLTGWTVLDPLLALVVAVNILWQGWKLIGASVQGLMDSAVEPETQDRIRAIITANCQGAIEVHDLKTRIAARATFIEFHLVVDATMTVRESHAICDRIEAALKAEFDNLRIIIHVEPEDEAKAPHGGAFR